MKKTPRQEKTVKFLPDNYAYLHELKIEMRSITGLSISFNDLITMLRHRLSVLKMVEQLTIKAEEKNNDK